MGMTRPIDRRHSRQEPFTDDGIRAKVSQQQLEVAVAPGSCTPLRGRLSRNLGSVELVEVSLECPERSPYPMIEDLKRKDVIAAKEMRVEDALRADFRRDIESAFRTTAPYMRLVCRAVGVRFRPIGQARPCLLRRGSPRTWPAARTPTNTPLSAGSRPTISARRVRSRISSATSWSLGAWPPFTTATRILPPSWKPLPTRIRASGAKSRPRPRSRMARPT